MHSNQGMLEDPQLVAHVRNCARHLLEASTVPFPVVRFLAPDGPARRARVAVVDHGIGVPPEDRERIFEPRRRGAAAQAGASLHGMGLGLYICREIVRSHGGTLLLDSSAEGGTTFTVTLPRAQPA